MNNFQNMMLVSYDWNGTKTFRMLPAADNCPYLEAIYDPTEKVLAVISKISKPSMRFIEKVDSGGNVVMRSRAGGGKEPAMERKMMDSFHQYFIKDETDIMNFVEAFSINASLFKYQDVLTPAVVEVEPVEA